MSIVMIYRLLVTIITYSIAQEITPPIKFNWNLGDGQMLFEYFSWNDGIEYLNNFCSLPSQDQRKDEMNNMMMRYPADSLTFAYYHEDTSQVHILYHFKYAYMHHIFHKICERNSYFFSTENLETSFNDLMDAFQNLRLRRVDVITYLVTECNSNFTRYLEIGTDNDALFTPASTKLFNYSIGVDPSKGGNRRMTSDEFFLTNNDYFDVIFIDGLHEANQVFRDVMHSLQYLRPGGVILLHDCNPIDSLGATYPQPAERAPPAMDQAWNGDTYKALIALRMRPDLDIVTIDIDWGIGVVLRRRNRKLLSQYWRDYLSVNPISMLSYQILEASRAELLNLVTFPEFKDWITSSDSRASGQ